MTTKDIVYLILIVFAALIFYCHGFFSGVNRSRRLYESLLGNAEQERSDEEAKEEDWLDRKTHIQLPPSRGQEFRGDFGDN
jgi:hypothetical protein